jgi:hypothetical protein
MGSPTGFLTLNTSEWPSDAAVCSLSDTLETGDVQRKYYLTPRACQGILRRAEKRGKALPPLLEHSLRTVAERTDLPETVTNLTSASPLSPHQAEASSEPEKAGGKIR